MINPLHKTLSKPMNIILALNLLSYIFKKETMPFISKPLVLDKLKKSVKV